MLTTDEIGIVRDLLTRHDPELAAKVEAELKARDEFEVLAAIVMWRENLSDEARGKISTYDMEELARELATGDSEPAPFTAEEIDQVTHLVNFHGGTSMGLRVRRALWKHRDQSDS